MLSLTRLRAPGGQEKETDEALKDEELNPEGYTGNTIKGVPKFSQREKGIKIGAPFDKGEIISVGTSRPPVLLRRAITPCAAMTS